jgi:hypothetical protein
MRKMPVIRIAVISILALALVFLMGSTASAQGSQSWYLTKNRAGIQADDGTRHSCDNIMRKLKPPPRQPGMELIGEIGPTALTAWWYSKNAAECNVTFSGENDWQVELYYINTIGSGSLQAHVWSVDESGYMERLLAEGEAPVHRCDGYTALTMECSDCESTDQTVLKDHRLALRVSYDPDQCADGVLLFYGSKYAPARLLSPETDPGFPLPELPAIVLLAGGLVCLGGYVVLKRRKAVNKY